MDTVDLGTKAWVAFDLRSKGVTVGLKIKVKNKKFRRGRGRQIEARELAQWRGMTHNSVTVPWLCLKKHFSTAVNKECYPVICAILALPVGHVFVNSQRTS